MLLLMVNPRQPAPLVFCGEAWSDATGGVPGKVRGRSITKCECRDGEEEEEEGVI